MSASRPWMLVAAGLVALIGAAGAQPIPPASIPNAPPPGVRGPQPIFPTTPTTPATPTTGSVCSRLETALTQLDAGTTTNPENLRRYDEAINKQRIELDQAIMQGRRMGCDSRGGFFLFGALTRPASCDPLDAQIGRMRANLERMTAEAVQMRGGDTGLEARRRQLIASLAQNNCGPQYRIAAAPQPARPRGLFESIFGGPLREESTIEADPLQLPQSGTFRTVCVRTCDGFFFPISYATTSAKFIEDENACQRLCPAAQTALYYYRNPGEEIEQAISIGGEPYLSMPNAFRYRQQLDQACTCRGPGQSWTEALTGKRDATIQPGDIVVTEERSKQMSQPLPTPAQKKSTKGPRQPIAQEPTPPPPPAPQATQAPAQPVAPGERKVRVVGPQFYPVR